MRILHVEDNAVFSQTVCKQLRKSLANQECLITTALSLDEAKALFENEITCDVILLNPTLPDAQGLDALTTLQELYKDTPIVVLSDADERDAGLVSVTHGAQDYLLKESCTADTILKSIEYAIERKRAENSIRTNAMTDELTTLPNRTYFLANLRSSMDRAVRSGLRLALLYIDFDGFKKLNDTYGHNQGDDFLREIGKRFHACIRKSDFCGRIGGDEFSVLIETEHHNLEPILPFLEKILLQMRVPFTLHDGVRVGSFCSIGVAFFDPETDRHKTINAFIHEADEAMYQAKNEGGDCYRIHESLKFREANASVGIRHQLRTALGKQQFFLQYQPIVQAGAREIAGLECFLRWRNDKNTVVLPDNFIAYLEESDLMQSVGRWALENAVDEFIAAEEKYENTDTSLSVNISATQLNDLGFVPFVAEQLNKRQHAKPWLSLEISERALVGVYSEPASLATIRALRDLGVRITIDNFGVGHCNLVQLLDLPIDIIKIDTLFAKKSNAGGSNAMVTKAIIDLAKGLKKTVMIEGVETHEACNILEQMGVDFLQGYYFSQPQMLEEIFNHPLNEIAQH